MIFKTITDESTLSGQRIVSALQARKIAQQQATAQLETDIACLKQYEIACQSGSVSTEQFDNIMKKASVTAKEYTANIKAGTGTAQSYAQAQKANNTALQSVGTGAGIASKAVKALSVTMNTIAITAFFTIVSKGISWITEQINDYIHRNEIAIEKAEELLNTFKSEVDTITSNQDKINGYADEFKELSKGVDDLGRNVSLTADEYSRYQSIVKEIVGINPSLISGYDEENNVLADKNGLIETSIQLLKDEYNQKLKNLALPDNVDTAINGAIGRYNSAKEDFLEVEIPTTLAFSGVKIDENGNRQTGYVNQISQYIEDVIGVEFTGWEGGINQYILDNAEAVFDNLDKIKERAAQTKDGWEGLNDSQLIDLMDYFKELRIAYNDMNNATTSANPTLQYVAMAEDSYSELSDVQKKFIADYVNGIQITSETTEQEKDNIRKSIISLTQELSDLDDIDVNNALADLYAIPTDEQSISEFVEQFNNALEIIKSYCQENGIEIPLSISKKEKDIKKLQEQYDDAIKKAKEQEADFDWDSWFKENSINTQEEIDRWNKIAESATNAADARKKYTEGEDDNKTDISLGISKTIDQLNTRLKPSMDSLKSAWQDIFTDDGFSLDNIDLLSTVDSIKSKLDELNKIDGITVDYSSFEDFVRILENTESTEEDVKQGFNELASSIVQASVSGIEDFQTLKDVLEDLGVVNNEIVAFQALAQNTDALKASGLDLLNATQYEIKAFASKRVSVENLSEAIIYLTEQQKYLQFQTEINSFQSMDTSQEIANLKNLAKNAGVTGDVISDLTELEQIYQAVASGVYGINTQQVAMAMERAKQLKNKIQEEISKENLKTPEIEFPEVKFEPKIDKSSAKKSADDLEKLTKDYVDSYMNYMEKSLESGRIDYQTYARDVAKFLKDMYDQGKIAAKDYHDYTKQMLEVQKNAMDSVISAVTNRLDKEIDSYEDQIDEVEKRYQTEIDYLDTVIDYYEDQKKALQDTNDELDRQKALEEALYNLEKKQTQKTIGLYTANKGKIYTTDTFAIRDAEDDVRKAKLDIEIAKLDEAIEKVKQQQDALQKAMDREKKQLQSIIERLEDYKDQWNSVADEYENTQNEMLASQILGADWESQILSGRIDTLNTFKNDYLSIQQAIADASLQAAKIAWESANEQIRAAQEAAKGVGGNTNNVSSLGFEKELDKNVKLTSKFNVTYGTTNPSEFEQKLNGVKKYGSLVVVESKKNNNKTNKLDKYYEKLKRGSKYASGTKNAKKGLNLVGEDGVETYIDNNGNVSLVTEPTLIPMEGGEIVKNESETKSLLNDSNLVPLQTSDLFKKLSVNMPDLSSMFKTNIPDYSNLVMRDNNVQQPSIVIGDIHLHEVQNVPDFAKALQKHLPNISVQYNGKH